jgi:hypothetical protein
MNIYLNTRNGLGLGDYLCTISLLANTPTPITLYADNREDQYNRISQLLRILNVPEDQLKIEFSQDHRGDFSGAWHLKTYCDYFYPEFVTLKGKQLKVKDPSRKKSYIGVCCYSGLDAYLDANYDHIRGSSMNEGNNGTRIPQCKYRSIDYYTKIMQFAKTIGYDVITLDDPNNIESKMEFILENCAAVIGYEGGIAHMCHMLQIPYLMLDWRVPNHDAQYGEFQCEVTHQSKTVYHLRSDDDLFRFTRKDFLEFIDKLTNLGTTNNRIVNGQVRMIPIKDATGKIDFVDRTSKPLFRSTMGPQLSDTAKEFVEHFYEDKFPYLSRSRGVRTSPLVS